MGTPSRDDPACAQAPGTCKWQLTPPPPPPPAPGYPPGVPDGAPQRPPPPPAEPPSPRAPFRPPAFPHDSALPARPTYRVPRLRGGSLYRMEVFALVATRLIPPPTPTITPSPHPSPSQPHPDPLARPHLLLSAHLHHRLIACSCGAQWLRRSASGLLSASPSAPGSLSRCCSCCSSWRGA